MEVPRESEKEEILKQERWQTDGSMCCRKSKEQRTGGPVCELESRGYLRLKARYRKLENKREDGGQEGSYGEVKMRKRASGLGKGSRAGPAGMSFASTGWCRQEKTDGKWLTGVDRLP